MALAPASDSRFLFTVCQLGAEAALKQEIAREHPELRFAYSRPGLVTFKDTRGAVAPDVKLRSIFARAWGISLGSTRDPGEIAALGPGELHVWERDRFVPGEEPPGYEEESAARVAAVRRQIEVSAGGELVIDVILGGDDEDWWVGCHTRGPAHSRWPGGRIPVVVPEDAPSRAYRKLEEALAWSGAPAARGDVAVEIGSAPGGASHALLRRGVRVVGVDPGEMDPRVLAHAGFRHVKKPVGEVRREDLPEHVDWLLLDVNLAPQVAIHSVRRLVSGMRRTLKGVLFTLKLNDWGMAKELPALLRRLEEMKLTGVRATQLPSNRREVFVYARVNRR